MQDIYEKKPYEKPVLEVCGSMVEWTLCDPWDPSRVGSIPGGKPHGGKPRGPGR
jgi:hypothetical protein